MSVTKECRLCLQKTMKYINLFEEDFRLTIFELTSLEISEEDVLPKIACVSCIDEIQQASQTRRRILECHKKLLQLYKGEMDINQDEISTIQNFKQEKEIYITVKQEQIPTETVSEVVEMDHLPVKIEVKEDMNDISFDDPDLLYLGGNSKSIEGGDQNDCNELISEMVVVSIKQEFSLREKNLEETIEEKHYICDQCGQDFSQAKHDFYLHKLKHKKSKCELCGLMIRSVSMKKHIDTHTGLSSVCDLCGAICKNIESLRGHIYYMHKKSAEEHKCDQCPKKFRRKHKLKEHQNKEHTGVRTHICHFCQKKFFDARTLKNHVDMTHLKLRPHICDYCQKGFSSQHALKTHVRQHTNETPYKCSVCGEGFRQNVSLRTHLKSKHNIEEDKKVPCEFCDKSFATHMALKVHLTVHSNKTYKCDYCQEYFNQKFYLLSHMKSVHNIDENNVDVEKLRHYYRKDECFDEGN